MMTASLNSGIRCAVRLAIEVLLAWSLQVVHAAEGPRAPVKFDIAPQILTEALIKYSQQSGIQVSTPTVAVDGKSSAGVVGSFSPAEALVKLLDGTGLEYDFIDAKTVAIREKVKRSSVVERSAEAMRLARVEEAVGEGVEDVESARPAEQHERRASEEADENSTGIPEILVRGKRSLNVDIRRTEDDIQPYVVFDVRQIEQTPASSIEDFLRTRLPMNQVPETSSQQPGDNFGSQSQINLRGIGIDQTLILVDGRRMPSVSNVNNRLFRQPDINGIPLSAVERIEVLPSTASGIYGGGATGGVVNIVLKRQYSGLETTAAYENTFDTDTAKRRFGVNAGLSFRGGATRLFFSANYADGNVLQLKDRDFAMRARAKLLASHRPPGDLYGIYTSPFPPPGYTTNIRVALGPSLTLLDGTTLDSEFTWVPVGYAGVASDGGVGLMRNAGAYNLDMPDSISTGGRSLLNSPTTRSALLTVHQDIGSRVKAFADLSFFENRGRAEFGPSTYSAYLAPGDPGNPFQEWVAVTVSLDGLKASRTSVSETLRAGGGLTLTLAREWTASGEYGWSRARTGYAAGNLLKSADFGFGSTVPVFKDGRIDVFRDTNAHSIDWTPYLLTYPNVGAGPNDITLTNSTLRLAGPMADVPGGSVRLSLLAEHRNEEFPGGYSFNLGAGNAIRYSYLYPRDQTVDSAYAELVLPLFAARNARRGVATLDVQASVRHDRYETTVPNMNSTTVPKPGDLPDTTPSYSTNKVKSTDYTLGIRYAPLDDVILRASVGTGFLAPRMSEIVPMVISGVGTFVRDPKRGGNSYAPDPLTLTIGGNPALKPEESESLSAGLIFKPNAMPGLRISIDYTRISKTDEIGSVSTDFLMENEDFLPGRILRAELESNPPPGYTAGPVIGIDQSPINIAATRVEAYDLQADYTWVAARLGTLTFYGIATLQRSFQKQVLPTLPGVDYMGFRDGPVKWRGNIGATWDRGSWTLGWNAQYYGTYRAYSATAQQATIDGTVLAQGSHYIPQQIYHDVFVKCRLGQEAASSGGILANSELSVSIRNLFNTNPPVIAHTTADDFGSGYSPYGDPRLRVYSLALRRWFQ